MSAALVAPPLALYVHFPWCVRKCPYCDFNSYSLHGQLPEASYVEALLRDLQSQAASVSGRQLASVFLGGGTPSLFSAEAIARVLDAARTLCGLSADAEVTLEANPGAIERGRFAEYRAAGINRVSLGAQSFAASMLERLGRIHSPQETCRAADELHAAGLENFNLDLMYALPGQDLRGALADIEQALALEPAHVSHYQLTLEPGTVFAAQPPALPDDDLAWEMLEQCAARLAAAGFAQYEVSAHARAGREARHNVNYWRFGDYLGIGAGAHGKLTLGGRIVRTQHTREPRRYLSNPTNPSRREVPLQDVAFEFMLNGLRLTRGFSVALFEERTGVAFDAVSAQLKQLRVEGLVSLDSAEPPGSEPGCWRTTPRGARFLNELLLRFLPSRHATAEVPLSTLC